MSDEFSFPSAGGGTSGLAPLAREVSDFSVDDHVVLLAESYSGGLEFDG